MALDFLTLYVIILLNSLSFAIVWLVIACTYRSMKAARFWLAALVMTCVSGPLLVSADGNEAITYVGLTLVAGSFAVMWQGVRVFHHQPPFWLAVVAIVAATFAALNIFGPQQEAINIIAAISQIGPVSFAMVALLRERPRYIGVYVAACAAGVLILGQGAEAITNALRLSGLMTIDAYYSVAAWFLVCAVIGGSVWNLGFLLMASDRFRAELRLLATRDDLTNLPNRRGLREKIAICEKSVRRKRTSAVLMMIDLDRFKNINDRFGHAAGDAALAHIGRVILSRLRDDDVLARIGGDEFCVLLPHTKLKTASTIAKRLIEAIASTPLEWKGCRVDLSASIGLSEWKPESSITLAEILPLADAAMFGSKRERNNSAPSTTVNLQLAG
ncbi:GGDEF domain-containing protein [Chelativorans sp. Marseille-P2723]|uniref:GGDEF domain-containing protein n=1 Tax=Chelativorans sp. Marseille-P2723 TaxID=2709133 RepID=UPI00156D538A|nr:GGDEF domain-containing protein [Chelativorans sp. Marseille-P2723]